MLQWLAGAPTLLLPLYFWFVPESVRWSVVNGRKEEARKTVNRACKINKVHIPEDVLNDELVCVIFYLRFTLKGFI